MAVLYRKYRPQTFAQVLNQKYIIQTLKNQVKSGSVSHAYLFTGSRGVGKTSVARILAKAVNCLHRVSTTPPPSDGGTPPILGGETAGDACGVCEVCKQIEAGNYLDLVEIDAASNTGVDNIRELIEHVKFSPSSGKYKVFIIDEVHMLSKGAFNALLKTLEEPPKHAIFILATTEINKVPATIISRTQRFDFKALSVEDLFGHLKNISRQENLKFADEVLRLVAENAEGSVRDALSLLDKLMTLGEEASVEDAQQLLGITDISICENLLELIAAGQAGQLPEFFNQLAEKGLDFKILNRDFLEYSRKALVYKITGSVAAVALSSEHKTKLAETSAKFSVPDVMFIIRLFLRSYKDLDSAPSAQIPLLLSAIEAALRKVGKIGAIGESELKAVHQPTSMTERSTMETPSANVKPPIVETSIQPKIEEAVPVVSVSFGEVQAFWPKVISKIKDINGPLSSMLRSAQLKSVTGNKIILGVKFLFDKQSVENLKNSALIGEVCRSLCGQKMFVGAEVIKSEVAETVGAPQALTDALKIFGGELIE